jgi:enterochelin esterase-like enzyme
MLRTNSRLIGLALAAVALGAARVVTAQQSQVSEHKLASKVLQRDRRLWVYTPAGYPNVCAPDCDLLVAFDGADYQRDIPLPAILDSLIAIGKVRPTVAVLVDNGESAARLADLANSKRFVSFIGDELVPRARERFKVSHDPHRAIITGSSAGGLAALYIALERPDLFGNVLAQSAALWRGAEGSNDAPYEWLTKQYAAAQKRDVRIFLDVGALETRGALGGAAPSIRDANRRLRDVLASKGYHVEFTEVPGGQHSPESWRLRLPVGLVALQEP